MLLRQAARVRLEAKAAQFSARARHAGWEQALWEGLFRALGYKHNAWPMQNLAESRPLWSRGAKSPLAFQARLLGIGGLLPMELSRLRAGGVDAVAKKFRHLVAPRLGLLVARARRICGHHPAARRLEISRPASGESSAAAAGARGILAGGQKNDFKN